MGPFTEMQMTDEYSKIYLLHVPKTAGTMLRQILEEWVSVAEIAADYEVPSPSKYIRKRLIANHFGLLTLKFLPQNTLLITALRDPRRRILSQYFHMKRTIAEKIEQQVRLSELETLISKLSFSEIFNHTVAEAFFSNVETRFLGDNHLSLAFPAHTKNAWPKYTKESRVDILENAKQTLNNSIFILDKNINVGLQMIADVFGESLFSEAGRNFVNARPRQDNIDTLELDFETKELEKFIPEEFVYYDYRLYDYASELFEHRAACYGAQFRYIRDTTRPMLGIVDFSKYYQKSGFSHREQFGSTYLHWIGSDGRAEIIFDRPEVDNDVAMYARIRGWLDLCFVLELRILVNDYVVDVERHILGEDPDEAILFGVISKECLAGGDKVSVVLDTGKPGIVPPGDTRRLSILLHSIEFHEINTLSRLNSSDRILRQETPRPLALGS